MLTPIIKTKSICREAKSTREKLGGKKLGAAGARATRKKISATRGGRIDLLADAVNGIQLVEPNLTLDL